MLTRVHVPHLVQLLRHTAERSPSEAAMALAEADRVVVGPVPGCATDDEEAFWDVLHGPVRRLVRAAARRGVGFVLPVEFVGGAICPSSPAHAEAVAVLAAWRRPRGAASICEVGEARGRGIRWRDAHAEAQWILTPLRGFVAERPAELELRLD